MLRGIYKRLKNSGGESLAETLVATLIIVMGMTMLAGAIISTARVNDATKNISAFGVSDGVTDTIEGYTNISIKYSTNSADSPTVTLYKGKGGVYFYEPN